MTRITDTLLADHYKLLIISRSVHLRVRNISDKCSRENQNTHFMFSNFFFSSKNRAVYEIMWKNVAERGRPLVTIWRMRIACWIRTHNQNM